MYPALVTIPSFVEIGDDDRPVATPDVLPDVGAAPQRPPRRGAPRTSNDPAQRRLRQYRADRAAIGRGEAITVASPADAPDSIPEDVIADTDDLAAVVVKRTLRGVAAGTLKPTLRDGLTAQQLLDRRAEKAADRSFMLNLAMALAGGGSRTPVKYLPAPNEPDPDIIEGTFEEQNLAPDHLRQG